MILYSVYIVYVLLGYFSMYLWVLHIFRYKFIYFGVFHVFSNISVYFMQANILENSHLFTGKVQKNGICEVLYAAAWIVGEFSE